MTSSISPVIVGHRGFKGNYPENTMIGFNKCFESGATIIETDLWLSKDNVIVISHDPSTKRVFVDSEGNETDYKIIDTNYEPTLRELKTIEGGFDLLSFKQVLHWFKNYGEEHPGKEFKLQLDIKRFNPAKILKQIIEDLLSVEPNMEYWYNKIQFGIWDLNFLKYLNQDDYFQDKFTNQQQFDIFNITVSWRDSIFFISYNDYLDNLTDKDRVKIKLTGVSLIYISTWSQGFLTKFVPLLKLHGLKLFSWTINLKFQYEYLCKVGELGGLVEYGVISDYPDVMAGYSEAKEEQLETTGLLASPESLRKNLTYKQWFSYFIFQIFHKFSSDKKLTDDEKQYDAKVDENKIRIVKVNTWIVWMFQTCQKFGIF
ncbi:Phosphatidylglycerol phospholipase C [Spathaspora sp. JA1]|nr:Phosphatidylglycerol phospholipase C [Spathaspora sp. JA1]